MARYRTQNLDFWSRNESDETHKRQDHCDKDRLDRADCHDTKSGQQRYGQLSPVHLIEGLEGPKVQQRDCRLDEHGSECGHGHVFEGPVKNSKTAVTVKRVTRPVTLVRPPAASLIAVRGSAPLTAKDFEMAAAMFATPRLRTRDQVSSISYRFLAAKVCAL